MTEEKRENFFKEKQGTILQMLLGGAILLFIAILITVYVVAKRANPIFLDEQGRPVNSENSSHH